MPGPAQLPELISDFVATAKDYLRQETIEPAKKLGRYGGFSALAGALAATAVLPLAVAGNRLLIEVFPGDPTHRMWSGLAYVITALVLFLFAGILVRGASR